MDIFIIIILFLVLVIGINKETEVLKEKFVNYIKCAPNDKSGPILYKHASKVPRFEPCVQTKWGTRPQVSMGMYYSP